MDKPLSGHQTRRAFLARTGLLLGASALPLLQACALAQPPVTTQAPAAPATAPTTAAAPAATTAPAAATAPAATVAPAAKSAAVTLRMSTIPGPPAEHFKADIEAFQKVQPQIQINLEVAGGAEEVYKANFPQIAASADKPDLAWYWVDGRQYQGLANGGLLEPLDDLYKSEGWDKVLPETTLKRYTQADGHRYSVNENIVWYPMVYYSTAAFQKAGVQPPKNGIYYETVDEWYQVCDKLRAAGYQPLTYGAKEGWIIGHNHDVFLQRLMPEDKMADLLVNSQKGATAKFKYSDPDWLAADKMLTEWQQKKVYAEGFLSRSYPEGRSLFVQGAAAMYQDGSWAPSSSILYKEAPDLDFGWMLYPQLKADIKPKFLIYPGNGIMILKGAKDVDAAKKFIAFVMSKERQDALAKSKNLVPARTDVSADVMKDLGKHVVDMWGQMPKVGTATGWDDPVPAELAQRSFVLFQELLSGGRQAETIGDELEKVADRLRKGV